MCGQASLLLCLLALSSLSSPTGGARGRSRSRDSNRAGPYVKECPAPDTFPDLRPDMRSNKRRLKLVHWNVDWLFGAAMYSGSGRTAPLLECPGEDCTWATHRQAAKHRQKVAETLAGIDGDIVSLNEVQDCTVLKDVSKRVKMEIDGRRTPRADKVEFDVLQPLLAWGRDWVTGQNVGLLSKITPAFDVTSFTHKRVYPVKGTKCFDGYPGSYKENEASPSELNMLHRLYGPTKALVSSFKVKGLSKPLAVLSAHLVAMPDDHMRCAKREAAALALADVIKALKDNGYLVALLGDMNDFDHSEESRDSQGSQSQSRTLEILKGGVLHSVASKVPKEKRFTYSRPDSGYKPAMLDHILLDEELLRMVKSVEIHHEVDVSDGSWYSDHLPISVTFELPSTPPPLPQIPVNVPLLLMENLAQRATASAIEARGGLTLTSLRTCGGREEEGGGVEIDDGSDDYVAPAMQRMRSTRSRDISQESEELSLPSSSSSSTLDVLPYRAPGRKAAAQSESMVILQPPLLGPGGEEEKGKEGEGEKEEKKDDEGAKVPSNAKVEPTKGIERLEVKNEGNELSSLSSQLQSEIGRRRKEEGRERSRSRSERRHRLKESYSKSSTFTGLTRTSLSSSSAGGKGGGGEEEEKEVNRKNSHLFDSPSSSISFFSDYIRSRFLKVN